MLLVQWCIPTTDTHIMLVQWCIPAADTHIMLVQWCIPTADTHIMLVVGWVKIGVCVMCDLKFVVESFSLGALGDDLSVNHELRF